MTLSGLLNEITRQARQTAAAVSADPVRSAVPA